MTLLLQSNVIEKETSDYLRLSQELFYAVRSGEKYDGYKSDLQTADAGLLKLQLNTDEEKKAFWLNIYNAYVQILLHQDPDQYKSKSHFFKTKQIIIGGILLSLDDIEHGILRHSKIKWSLGYFNKPFPSAFEKEQRLKIVDYRIHFALNCGAKSCPPIAYYSADKIDHQLELSKKNYLGNEAEYNSEKNVVSLPAIMSWFRRDFNGKKGMIEILKRNNIIPQNTFPKIKFKSYDWNIFLNNYKNENNE